ncbi:MAG: choice-of-anchor D domain-containing protein [Myxococcales bacterium]
MARALLTAALVAVAGCSSPNLAASTSRHDFGGVPIGTVSSAFTITVTNSGSAASGVPHLTISGSGAAGFAVQGTPCTAALGPAASCSAAVRFAPVSTGPASAVLTIAASPGGTSKVALIGEGLQRADVTAAALAGGSGTITDDAGSAPCSGSCTEGFAGTAQVTFTAHPNAGSIFDWSGDCAGSAATCGPLSMAQARTVVARFRKPLNMMFVTSKALQLPFGATADAAQSAADAFCMARAVAANLPGTYRAWLGTSTLNAIDKLGTADGWVRVDGMPVVDRALLSNGGLYYTPDHDETGAAPPLDASTPPVATGTFADGTADLSNGNCHDWTSTAGTFLAADPVYADPWFLGADESCDGAYALYCFETDYSASITPHATGRLAFESAGQFTPGGGLAAADQLCHDEAAGAALSGTFLALLTTTTTPAAARFSAGTPWVRVDGVQLAASPADLALRKLPAQLDVSAGGQYLGSAVHNAIVWSGSPSAGDVGTAASTCSDWTSTSGNADLAGADYVANEWFNAFPATPCSSAAHVYCLQQ